MVLGARTPGRVGRRRTFATSGPASGRGHLPFYDYFGSSCLPTPLIDRAPRAARPRGREGRDANAGARARHRRRAHEQLRHETRGGRVGPRGAPPTGARRRRRDGRRLRPAVPRAPSARGANRGDPALTAGTTTAAAWRGGGLPPPRPGTGEGVPTQAPRAAPAATLPRAPTRLGAGRQARTQTGRARRGPACRALDPPNVTTARVARPPLQAGGGRRNAGSAA